MKNGKEYYTIEEGIPLPTEKANRFHFKEHPQKRYHFEDMRVGDSFLAPIYKKPASISGAGKSFAKRRGIPWEFEVRVMDDGVRCWRTK